VSDYVQTRKVGWPSAFCARHSSVALTIWFGSDAPSLLEPHARLSTIFGDELDAGGAGRILDEATIWLEARDATKLKG